MPPFARTLLEAVIGLVALALAWLIAAWLVAVNGHPMFLPSPLVVIPKAIELCATEAFRQHVWVSVATFGQGFVPAVLVGIALGAAVSLSNGLRWLLGPLVVVLAAAPVIAFAPVLILWLGVGMESKALLVFLMVAFPVANTVALVQRSHRHPPPPLGPPQTIADQIDAALSAPPAPGPNAIEEEPEPTLLERAHAMPLAIMAGLRLGVILGLVAVIASEMISSRSGLGAFIVMSFSTFDSAAMLAAIVVLALPTIVLVTILQAIEEQVAA
ncbi:MAG: putative hydroxymethylpyrimidine transport system permease protein [Alphaproteobacteria bacterium]|jgi:ABC-type nitrate/sulfonate/bicarbonate transport system permease component|nr:putative hydroxymethylpyrimidine transport system permease protein [Alphaproteobacteria bacterium]